MSLSKHDKKIIRVFKKIGFIAPTKMADSLQGSIWRVQSKNEPMQHFVIKVTDQFLHQNKMSNIIDEQQYHVGEDILIEQSILKYLTQNEHCPKSIVKFERFFKTNTDYYLIMEDGGSPLFDFVMKAHQLILSKKIEISHWQKVSKIIFKQMIDCISYIHSKNVCHFDISLENWVINDIQIEVEHRGENEEIIRFNLDNIQVSLCDFGLAELFTSSTCKSSKVCGKNNYKSPEIANHKKRFDAKKNDIWCLGACYFMICTGLAPWNIANESDEAFVYVVKYRKLKELLSCWDVSNYMDQNTIYLLESIFQYESLRISLDKMAQHPALYL